MEEVRTCNACKQVIRQPELPEPCSNSRMSYGLGTVQLQNSVESLLLGQTRILQPHTKPQSIGQVIPESQPFHRTDMGDRVDMSYRNNNRNIVKTTQEASIPLKTPVSLLNEVCVKAKVIPVFETTEEGPPHEKIFECIVKVERDGLSWRGKGQAKVKKDAKQEAAKALLFTMDEHVEALLVPTKSPVEERPTLMCDPDVTGNPIGELNELCLKIKRLPPDYEEIDEEGRPHERVFTIACKLGDQIIEHGRGPTKKHAKKVAASKVKQRLTEIMMDSNGMTLPQDTTLSIVDQLKAVSLNPQPGKKPDESWTLGTWFAEFKDRTGIKLTSLQDKTTSTCPIKLLQEIAGEQKFKIEYLDINKPENTEEYSAIVSIGIEPVAIFLGSGGSKTQARKCAASKAIEFLRIAINNSS